MIPDALAVGVVIALGLVWGSFFNVCIHRIPRGESVLRPKSRCPACGRPLAWYDNLPIVGYLALGARCRWCRASISAQYPLVEATTALLFLAQYRDVGWGSLLAARLVFTGALVVLFVIDLRHRILPNVITIPGIVVGVALSFFVPPGWRDSIIGMLLGGGALLAIAELYRIVRREEGLGMGDVKMLAMIGAFLGWQLTLLTLFLSSLAGSVVGILMMVTRKGGLKYALPYGAFLAIGALVASLVGSEVIKWYLSLYS